MIIKNEGYNNMVIIRSMFILFRILVVIFLLFLLLTPVCSADDEFVITRDDLDDINLDDYGYIFWWEDNLFKDYEEGLNNSLTNEVIFIVEDVETAI